ncbi:hypothetical protein [Butyricicoccus sp. OF10-2]|uniref:hypothetical protein n=1 Tax=Butyricicoccus sp. OF10-2 TaxID=2292298 RepID=UPI000E5D66A6|nr:hypothetical protein [Butyricicoccus sp. OF10-2]RHV80135.1 hypothetical protein DXB00_13270 [Butyricicoccus sp. OF10-2]
MEITGEYWRSERCGLLLAKPCCSTLGLARYLLWSVYQAILHVSDELIEKIYIDFFNRLPEFMQNALSEDFRVA